MNGNAIFPGETMDAAHFYSKGIPRVMNLLCEHALINAFADELRQVPASAVQEAARDFLLTETPSGAPRQRSDSGCDPAAIRSPLEEELIQRLAVIETGLCEGALGIGPFLPTVSGIDLTEGLASANEDAASVLFFSAPLATARPGRNLLSAVMGMLTFRPKSDLSGTASSILAPSVVVPPWIRTLVYLLELRMRVFGAVRRNRPFLYARQTLRTWVAEFKRDWIAMMEAVEFPQVRKTLLQWLRQPAASKRMDAERKQPV
jgi:hypothetical protein